MPQGGALVGGGRGGAVVNVTVNVTQPLGTPYELARVVKQALLADDRSLGKVL